MVRIAGTGHCSDVRDVILDVVPGRLMLNGENQKREDLARRLIALP